MKLNLPETKALVKFWETYMSIRKAFEDHQDARVKAGMSVDYKMWLEFQERKTQARDDLEMVIPEISYEGFWRDVVSLHPDSVVAGILRHRKELQTAREQRAKEKSVLTGRSPENDKRAGVVVPYHYVGSTTKRKGQIN